MKTRIKETITKGGFSKFYPQYRNPHIWFLYYNFEEPRGCSIAGVAYKTVEFDTFQEAEEYARQQRVQDNLISQRKIVKTKIHRAS